MGMISQIISDNIIMFRNREGLSQKELADRVGKSTKTILRYESGEYNINLNMVRSIADVLNVSIGDILTEYKEVEKIRDSFKVVHVSRKKIKVDEK